MQLRLTSFECQKAPFINYKSISKLGLSQQKFVGNKGGSITGILKFDGENGATTPSLSCKIILEHQEKVIN